MNKAAINSSLAELASHPGIRGCALVDPETGMVWYHAGDFPDLERTGEAAVEFWRVQIRLSTYFSALGAAQSATCSFVDSRIALFPCLPSPLILICITSTQSIDWSRWGESAGALKKVLAQTESPATR